MNRLLTSGCSPSSDILDLRRTGTPTVFLLCCGPSPLCLVAASSWREQVLGYKCAEDKLESTVGLALAAFQALTPALIIANRGQNWVGAVHLHWDWKLLPLKLWVFFFFQWKLGFGQTVPTGIAACQLQDLLLLWKITNDLIWFVLSKCLLMFLVWKETGSLWAETCCKQTELTEQFSSDNKRWLSR